MNKFTKFVNRAKWQRALPGTCIFGGVIKANERCGTNLKRDPGVSFSGRRSGGCFVSNDVPSCSPPPPCFAALVVAALFSSRPKPVQPSRCSLLLRGCLLLESCTRTTTLFHGVLDPKVARLTFLTSSTFTLQPAKSTVRAVLTGCSSSALKTKQTLRLLKHLETQLQNFC
jgi:hypothetical protein